MAGSRGIERVLAKCEACISDGNFYEAHQMIRTLYFRLVVVYVWFILMVWSDNFIVESVNQPVFLDAKPKRISIWHSTAITLIISYNIQFFSYNDFGFHSKTVLELYRFLFEDCGIKTKNKFTIELLSVFFLFDIR